MTTLFALLTLVTGLAQSEPADPSQVLFAAGLAEYEAYNHDAALVQFERCIDRDPNAFLCMWGMGQARATLNAIYKAELPTELAAGLVRAAARAEAAEAGLAASLLLGTARYIENPDSNGRLSAYTQHLRELSQAHPEDPDISFLLADALLRKVVFGCHGGGGMFADDAEVFEVLAQGLRHTPLHAGLHHLVVHVTERSNHPEKGMESAQLLPRLANGHPHLVHMPGHTYLRLGMFSEAAEANAAAIALDEAYLATMEDAGWYYDSLVLHNRHFLWFTRLMLQQLDQAERDAENLLGGIRSQTQRLPTQLQLFSSAPSVTAIRRGKAAGEPVAEGPYVELMTRLANGLAALKSRQDASEHLAYLTACLPSLPKLGLEDVGKIAQRLLQAEIAANSGRWIEAEATYHAAIQLEDALPYMEPWKWQLPVREFYARALTSRGRTEVASRLCREELEKHPGNLYAIEALRRAE